MLTYGLYLLLLRSFSAHWSYTAVYVVGIVLAYLLNRVFVFRAHAGWKSVVAMFLIYIVQYGLSMAVVTLWGHAGLPDELAPLPVIAMSLPLTYVLSRLSFLR